MAIHAPKNKEIIPAENEPWIENNMNFFDLNLIIEFLVLLRKLQYHIEEQQYMYMV